MRNLKLLIICFSVLLLGGSTILTAIPLNLTEFSTEIDSNTAIPSLSDEKKDIFDEQSPVDISSVKPTFAVQDIVPEPTINITDVTEHSMSLTGHGTDTLRFSMQFRPAQTAYYSANVWVNTNNSANREQIGQEDSWYGTVTGGTVTVMTFDFCGYFIRDKGVDGPYAIYMNFEKDNGSMYTIYNDHNILNTTNYLATDFHKFPVIPDEGGITNTSVDADGNDLYEWIEINIPVTVTIPGNYKFWGYLDYDSSKTIKFLTTGSHTVIIRFAGWHFRSMSPGSLFFDMTIQHWDYPSYSFYNEANIYSIASVDASIFDNPPLKITNYFYEQPLDTDESGYYDTFHVTVTLNITRNEPGYFNLWSSLYINDTAQYIDDNNVYINSFDEQGLFNFTFEYEGPDIYFSGITFDNFLVSNFYGYYYHRVDDFSDGSNFPDQWITSQTYSSSEFDGPGAQLTHIFNDYGEDTDSDGLYNNLIVDVQVNVTKPGSYQVSSWIEENDTQINIDWASNTEYLDVGIRWITLVFEGLEFYESDLNDNIKFESLTLFDNNLNGASVDNNNSAVLSHYLFSEFDPPKVKLTGIYADTPIGFKGNYTGIKIQVEIIVNQTGRYRVEGRIGNPITGNDRYTESESYYTGTGKVSMNLTFSESQWFWSQRMNTTYLLEYVRIEEVDDSENHVWTWDEENNAFGTDLIYNSTDFAAPIAYFTGNFVEGKRDLDSDGFYDLFVISVEVEATESVYVELEGELDTGTKNNWYYNDTALDIGYNWIELVFSSLILYETYGNFSYIMNFNLYKQEGEYLFLDGHYNYITAYYNYSNWDPHSIELTGNFFDVGVDSDSNGKYNFIELKIEVNVLEIGTYRLYGYIYAQMTGGNSFYFNWDFDSLGIGLQNLTFQISHNWVHSKDDGDSFFISYMYLYKENPGYDDVEQDYDGTDRYFANTYYQDEFELPDAFVIDIIDDYGVDIDNDSLFDFYYVVFQINVTIPEFDMRLYTRIEEQVTEKYITDEYYYVYDLPIGIHNITVEYEGLAFYDSNFTQGAFISEYTLYNSYDWIALKEKYDFDWKLTNAMNWTQFTDTPPNYIRITDISPSSHEIFERDESIHFSVWINKFGTAKIAEVYVEVTIDNAYYNTWYLTYEYGDSQETWATSIHLDKGGLWQFEVTAKDYDGNKDKATASCYVLGGPIFFTFSANTSSLMADEAVYFEVDVWDEDGIQNLTLHIEGKSGGYPLSHIGNASIGELWSVTVTFETVGQYSVYVLGFDMNGTSSISNSLTIYVNEGPRIISVDVSPSTTVDIGTEVTFTVVVEKTNAIITSVTLEVQDEDDIYYLEALEESARTTYDITFIGTFTPKKSGRHVCTIIVLTTKNQQSNHEVILRVEGEREDLQIAPGFELIAVLGVLIVLPLARKKYNK
ncbi:MAG: hypothetical protein ACXAD7_21215 [Candidatus Kariarchaeaceae archaeon]|jgi:hypothetical protein